MWETSRANQQILVWEHLLYHSSCEVFLVCSGHYIQKGVQRKKNSGLVTGSWMHLESKAGLCLRFQQKSNWSSSCWKSVQPVVIERCGNTALCNCLSCGWRLSSCPCWPLPSIEGNYNGQVSMNSGPQCGRGSEAAWKNIMILSIDFATTFPRSQSNRASVGFARPSVPKLFILQAPK